MAEGLEANLDKRSVTTRRASSATLDNRRRMEAGRLQGVRRALSAARARTADEQGAEARECEQAEGDASAAPAAAAGSQPSATAQGDAEAALRAALGWNPAPADSGELDAAMRALGSALLQGAAASPAPAPSHREREREADRGARGPSGPREGHGRHRRHLR